MHFGVSLTLILTILGLITAAVHARRDIDEKLDATRFVNDSITRSGESREIIRRLDAIGCRQVKPAAACPP